MNILHAHPLRLHNTLNLPATAEMWVEVQTPACILELQKHPLWQKLPKKTWGGGSNVVCQTDIGGWVLHVAIMGKACVGQTNDHWLVQAGGGENWHDFVKWTLQQSWGGLENLALIPGNVGACPVQNIGAYGVEIEDRLHSLDAIDLETGELKTFDNADCRFAYRDSLFKHHPFVGRWLITHVRFALPKRWVPVLTYADLARQLNHYANRIHSKSTTTPQMVFDVVCTIRQSKLPDPKILANAGSFFKNPVLSANELQKLLLRYPSVVHHELSNERNKCYKLAAGWLIEQAGWKGKRWKNTDAGVYEKQALVLVNHGHANGSDILALANAIQNSVKDKFGVKLEIEPVIY